MGWGRHEARRAQVFSDVNVIGAMAPVRLRPAFPAREGRGARMGASDWGATVGTTDWGARAGGRAA